MNPEAKNTIRKVLRYAFSVALLVYAGTLCYDRYGAHQAAKATEEEGRSTGLFAAVNVLDCQRLPTSWVCEVELWTPDGQHGTIFVPYKE